MTKVAEAALSPLAGTWWSAAEDAVVRPPAKMACCASTARGSIDFRSAMVSFGVSGPTGVANEWRFHRAGEPREPGELRITDAWPMPRIFTRLTAPVPSASALAAYARTAQQ